MSNIWLPGHAGPLDDLIGRIQRRVQRFAETHEVEQPVVEVELTDGALLMLETLSPEPGYGFLTLVPHPDEEGDPPYELVVPVGAIRQFAIRLPEPARGRFGFAGFEE
jgi:hypothetical protein